MKTTSRFAHTPLAIALALGIAVALGGCASEPIVDGGDTGSSQSGENTPAEGASSTGFTDKKGLVPDWVAEGFPIHPNSVSAGAGEAGGETMISFSVPNVDEQDLYDWFIEQYSQNGWEAHDLDPVSYDFSATNADGRKAYVNVTKSTFVMSVKRG